MGYIFTVLALLSGLIKGFCGKKISGQVSTLKGTFYINSLRMLICIVVGFFIVMTNGISTFEIDSKTLLITVVSGICTAMFVVSWIFRKNGLCMLCRWATRLYLICIHICLQASCF